MPRTTTPIPKVTARIRRTIPRTGPTKKKGAKTTRIARIVPRRTGMPMRSESPLIVDEAKCRRSRTYPSFEPVLRPEGQGSAQDHHPDVRAQNPQGTDGLGELPDSESNADVGGCGNGRHRDGHPGRRCRARLEGKHSSRTRRERDGDRLIVDVNETTEDSRLVQ